MSEQLEIHAELPEGAVPTAVIELVLYITPEGRSGASFRRHGDCTYSDSIGWLEWAKANLLRDWSQDYPDSDA